MAAQTRDDVTAEIARARNHSETPDLRDWNLTGADLYNLDLTDADLHLTNVNLTDADLHLTDLRGANLTGTNLTRAWLRTSFHSTEQLLDTYGLNPTFDPQYSMTSGVWDDLLPKDPTTRELAIALLQDWDGTLREAITTAEELRKS